jgi:vacuolar-type H+-ATPase subunit H
MQLADLQASNEREGGRVSWVPHHKLLEEISQREREARLRLADAREQAERTDGEASREHHELIHKLEAEWKHALEHLHRARQGGEE